MAIELVQARSTARLDVLTGLLNRRGFIDTFDRVRCEGLDGMRPGMLLFADVDGLKARNDRHGHAAGDALIAGAARAVADVAGPGAVVGRWGGDEFVAYVVTERSTDEVVADLHERFADLSGPDASLSVGVALDDPEARHSLDDLLQAADAAMYAAKSAAR